MSGGWPWLALGLLGAYHGVNPAMGWLFAVALGLQERSRSAVLRALPAIALGHEASVGLVVALVAAAGALIDPGALRVAAALALLLFGAFRLARPRAHFRWVGMRITPWELAVWSFLMSTAHGAGLMLVPVLLGMAPVSPEDPLAHDLPGLNPATATVVEDAAAVVLHTLAMLASMAAVALVVYEKVGLAVLRTAWLNLDVVWAVALVAAGVVTLFS